MVLDKRFKYVCGKCKSDNIGVMTAENTQEYEYCRDCGATWQDIKKVFKPVATVKYQNGVKPIVAGEKDKIHIPTIGAGLKETMRLMWMITKMTGKFLMTAGMWSLKAMSVGADLLFKDYDTIGKKYFGGKGKKGGKEKIPKPKKEKKTKELGPIKTPYDDMAKPPGWVD